MSHSVAPAHCFQDRQDEVAPSSETVAVARVVESLRVAAGPVSSEELMTYMHLVRSAVARFTKRLPPSVQRDDILSAGTIGLMDALTKHQGERGAQFEWYARVRIRGAIVDELRKQDWLSRRERARAADPGSDSIAPTFVGIDDVREAALPVQAHDDLAERHAEQVTLWHGVERLPTRERTIVQLHYGSGVQFKELAKALGVSVPRISQLHARALLMLREILHDLGEEWTPSAA